MSDTCVPSLIVICTAINTKVSLKSICCLRLFVVVYKHVMFYNQRQWWETHVHYVLLSSAPPLTSFIVLYITNSTLVPEAICCCLQTSTYCCFYQGGEIYIMYRYFCSQNF